MTRKTSLGQSTRFYSYHENDTHVFNPRIISPGCGGLGTESDLHREHIPRGKEKLLSCSPFNSFRQARRKYLTTQSLQIAIQVSTNKLFGFIRWESNRTRIRLPTTSTNMHLQFPPCTPLCGPYCQEPGRNKLLARATRNGVL